MWHDYRNDLEPMVIEISRSTKSFLIGAEAGQYLRIFVFNTE